MLNAPKQSTLSVFLLEQKKCYLSNVFRSNPLISDFNESADRDCTSSTLGPCDEIVVILRTHDELHGRSELARERVDVNGDAAGGCTLLDEVHAFILIGRRGGIECDGASEIDFRNQGKELEGLRSTD